MIREDVEKLSDVDLVGQLISYAHQFGDIIQETGEFAKELLKRLNHVADLQKENEEKADMVVKLLDENLTQRQRIEELERENSKQYDIRHGEWR